MDTNYNYNNYFGRKEKRERERKHLTIILIISRSYCFEEILGVAAAVTTIIITIIIFFLIIIARSNHVFCFNFVVFFTWPMFYGADDKTRKD